MMETLSIRRCNDPSCWCRNPKWNGDGKQRGIPMSQRKMYLVKQEKMSNAKETCSGK
jgi:hypothetical protein